MCIGAPMQVVRTEGSHAWCEADGRGELLDMRLVGEQPAGTWVLAFHGAARQLLSAEEAGHASAARQALASVISGHGDVDAFFADLVGREPSLPAHLMPTRSMPVEAQEAGLTTPTLAPLAAPRGGSASLGAARQEAV